MDVFHPELGLIRLFFMHLIDPATGTKEWAVFITTDTSMAISSMVEHYAYRFGIEVFYKESKQYLGFMDESVRSFEAVTACLHIAAMRHAVLSSLAVLKGVKREEVTHGLAALSYAQKLWNVFTFEDGADKAPIEKSTLMKVLSTGEKKALYVLNIIFEVEADGKRVVQ